MLPGFWDPGCHPCTLIELVNTALARRESEENICMIWEGCRTHRVVTRPMNFKKIGSFFRKIVLPEFWGPWLPSNHFDRPCKHCAAIKGSLETNCMITEGYRTHRGVTGSKNFKKSGGFFSEKRATGIWGHWLPCKHFN